MLLRLLFRFIVGILYTLYCIGLSHLKNIDLNQHIIMTHVGEE